MFKTAHTWKLANIVPIPKPNKDLVMWFNQMAPLAQKITVKLEVSKAFDTINIHTLIRKLLQTYIPGTMIKFIANYNKGPEAYISYINHTSRQRQLKLAFHKVASFHPHNLTFTHPTYHHPVHRFRSWPMQTTSKHTSTREAKKYIQPYLHNVFA